MQLSNQTRGIRMAQQPILRGRRHGWDAPVL
jgi:hypothetical protein